MSIFFVLLFFTLRCFVAAMPESNSPRPLRDLQHHPDMLNRRFYRVVPCSGDDKPLWQWHQNLDDIIEFHSGSTGLLVTYSKIQRANFPVQHQSTQVKQNLCMTMNQFSGPLAIQSVDQTQVQLDRIQPPPQPMIPLMGLWALELMPRYYKRNVS